MIDPNKIPEDGAAMHALATRLWPITRSITGNGVRKSLDILSEHLPELRIYEVPSGKKCFDWTIPSEWNVNEAWLKDPDGKTIADIRENNLHLLGYSTPISTQVTLDDLQEHLYSLPEQPTAIPYMTSYYKERWGFCIADDVRKSLKPGLYDVHIDSTLDSHGSLTYGELVVPGETTDEVLVSTYICHPSMANNELSGPVVTTFLAKWISEQPSRKFTYRFVFIPETIGSICYLSQNIDSLKKHVKAGFNVTCIGDDRSYSYLPSRQGDAISDVIACHVLKNIDPEYRRYSWSDRGSDERQYCAPGIDLPIASVMRTKYGEYPEYHTSLDDLNLITPNGLNGGLSALKKCLEILERDKTFHVSVLGEPQLGKRGLYPNLSTKDTKTHVADMMNLISMSDGERSVFEIAELFDICFFDLIDIAEKLAEHDVLIEKP